MNYYFRHFPWSDKGLQQNDPRSCVKVKVGNCNVCAWLLEIICILCHYTFIFLTNKEMYEVISTYPGCLEIPIKDHKLDSWFLIWNYFNNFRWKFHCGCVCPKHVNTESIHVYIWRQLFKVLMLFKVNRKNKEYEFFT